jgi:hypothetical protein
MIRYGDHRSGQVLKWQIYRAYGGCCGLAFAYAYAAAPVAIERIAIVTLLSGIDNAISTPR